MAGQWAGLLPPLRALQYLRRLMSSVYLNRKISPRVANGHPWVFANEVEIDGVEGRISWNYSRTISLSEGYINPKSQILVRLLSGKSIRLMRNTLLSGSASAGNTGKKSGIRRIAALFSGKPIHCLS
jgi:23S rRNA (cytosine1962-C5)-methyltransferase